MITDWQCTARSEGISEKGKMVWGRCPVRSSEMNLVGEQMLCAYHAAQALDRHPEAHLCLVRIPPKLQRMTREIEAKRAI